MKTFFQEHTGMLVVLTVFIAGFALFVAAANNGASNAANDADYKKVNFDSPMSKGGADAPVQLIQYSDFLCPSCTVVSTQVMPTIEKKYIDTGKVAFEFRPMAFVASSAAAGFGSSVAEEGAFCATDQDKFWEYHDTVYSYTFDKIMNSGIDPQYVAVNTPVLTADTLKSLVENTGLDQAAFSTCLDDDTHADDVANSSQLARMNGITSAPTVFMNGVDISSSATNLTALEALIEAQLK